MAPAQQLMTTKETIGIIGGSGLYEMDGFVVQDKVSLQTPYGEPSDAFVIGEMSGRRVIFLPRHGTGHRYLPHEINYRANIWGMKKLGVAQLLSVSAVGSMQEKIKPGHLVLVDQFIDLTRSRKNTFLSTGIVAHVPMAEPICPLMHDLLQKAVREVACVVHPSGTYICIEGPQFSTKAESKLYRTWNVDVIGMTNMPEAKLAKEAEISYAAVALATDYDCWRDAEESVSVDAILQILKSNVENAKQLIRTYIANAPSALTESPARTALRSSLLTPLANISTEIRQDLEPLLAPFLTQK